MYQTLSVALTGCIFNLYLLALTRFAWSHYKCTCQLSNFRKRDKWDKMFKKKRVKFLYFMYFTTLQKEGHMVKSICFFASKWVLHIFAQRGTHGKITLFCGFKMRDVPPKKGQLAGMVFQYPGSNTNLHHRIIQPITATNKCYKVVS